MSAALLWGDTVRIERNRTRMRQQSGPQDFKTTSPEVGCLLNSDRRPLEEEKSVPAVLAGDKSKQITNVGVLAKCVKRVHELVDHRHPDGRVPAADAAGFFTVLAALDASAVRSDASFVPDLGEWCARNLRALSEDAKAEIRAGLEQHPVEITAEFLGEQLGLSAAERRTLKFWSAEPIGAAALDARAVALETDRKRKQAKRREAGVAPRGERINELRLFRPGKSDATYRRWIAAEKAADEAAKAAKKGRRK